MRVPIAVGLVHVAAMQGPVRSLAPRRFAQDIEDDADEDEDEGPASKRAKYGGEGEEDDDGDD